MILPLAAAKFVPDTATDPAFICGYRSLAWEFAKKVQPSHDATLTFDALMLGATCNMTRPEPPPPIATGPEWAGSCNIYVSAAGSDSNPGTSATAAKKTVSAGLEATRTLKAPKTLCVGKGTFYLDATLEVTAQDSGLTITGSAAGSWISGAKPLPTCATSAPTTSWRW